MRKKQKKKVLVYIMILILLAVLGLYFKYYKSTTITINNPDQIPDTITTPTITPITIEIKKIKEENFSGTVPVISGDSKLAITTQGYIDATIREFRKEANVDVPDMRAKFGADSSISQYTIDINATQAESSKTNSIVISEYVYTGGANGNSAYKVITASKQDGRILSLGDVIKKDKQSAFTTLIKKDLNAWRPEGSSVSVIFPDEVKNLTFGSFTNWAITDKNLTIYFDKYEVGPGVLGPVAFPVSLTKLQGFLNESY